MRTVVAVFSAMVASLGFATLGPAQVPEKPKSLCEEYNAADPAVLLGRVVGHQTIVEEDPTAAARDMYPAAPIRVDAAVVAVLESFRGNFSGTVLITAEKRPNSAIWLPPRFDPPLEAGQSYVFYAYFPWQSHDHLVARLAVPASSAQIRELRQRSRMTSGSIYGNLSGLSIVRPGAATFLGRVTDRGYDTSSDARIERAQVAVVESFGGITAKETSIVAPLRSATDSPPFLYDFRPPLEVGETYLFVAGETIASSIASDGSTRSVRELIVGLILPQSVAPLEVLRHRRRSHADDMTDAKIIAVAKSDNSRFKTQVAATGLDPHYHFDDLPPDTYSLAVETEGIVFIGPWSAQVQAGGCAAVDLSNIDYLRAPAADCSSRTEHPSLCGKFHGARAVFMAENADTIRAPR